MVLSAKELVKLLRDSVNVQNSQEEDAVVDPAYLDMTDEDLELYIKLAISKDFSQAEDIEDLPEGSHYPVILLAKIELYHRLAVIKADKVDLTADNNNQLKQSQRFSHYMKLAEDTKNEYEIWLANNTTVNQVTTYNLLLDKGHYSDRNRRLGPQPKVKVRVDEVTADSIALSWGVSNSDFFGKYEVYAGKNKLVDMYRDGSTAQSKVLDGAKLVKGTYDIHNNHLRLTGLEPETEYHVAVFSIERNQLFGVKEIITMTLPVLEDEEEFEDTTL